MFPNKPKEKKLVYLDHAATTYVDKEVKAVMNPYYTERFANPSGLYGIGREVSKDVANARKSIAQILGAQADTIIFTSGGTESDNLAIQGMAYPHKRNGKHIITTKIEHPAVLETCKFLEKDGFEITYLNVNKEGQIDLKEFKNALRTDTILVSIMYANNEIGTILPIADVGREILKWRKTKNTVYPYFHSDACQAAGVLDLDVEKLHVDLLTINGSKIYGPKGIGVLYKRRKVDLHSLIHGGGQEMGLRAGTENVPGIIGLAKALELSQENKGQENKRLIELRQYFWEELQKNIDKIVLNGTKLDDEKTRLPNNLNVTFLDIEGEAMLLYLDEYGIVTSTGSACSSGSLDASHVLIACGLPDEYAHGSLRFTLGKRNTKEDVDYVIKYLPGIVEKLREISPVNLKYDKSKS
ncbi:MAG: cysteine desulfurase [Candidatus Magasanikbacteria bacterium]|jgi:cysteine desulfurase|nr:cysteine desulfurase [Candidatus Magasanikbacteria bacterium]MBT4315308.1 cysteine desulfurase [Candidatus Magasanikbacteria bacterium]MBT4547180.1 cysteine desulfurase [Candidatus Magasanikbacteria bacterium]MBT6819680.1 cysteine desulfurase [Candidatus Magasanikbacteria bacterium]